MHYEVKFYHMIATSQNIGYTKFPPVGEFLDENPLPPELAHFEPILRSPIGQNIIDAIVAAYTEGLSDDAMMAMIHDLATFHSSSTHRCTTCLHWTDAPARTGGVIANGKFHLIVTCKPCYRRIMAGAATPEMVRNLRAYGGAS